MHTAYKNFKGSSLHNTVALISACCVHNVVCQVWGEDNGVPQKKCNRMIHRSTYIFIMNQVTFCLFCQKLEPKPTQEKNTINRFMYQRLILTFTVLSRFSPFTPSSYHTSSYRTPSLKLVLPHSASITLKPLMDKASF